MITPSDIEYQLSKQIKLGNREIDQPFDKLAELIKNKFGVKPLNVYFDILQHNKRPRIQIIFERHEEVKIFKKGLSPKKSKQQEIKTLLESIDFDKSIYPIDNILVLFSSFEPLAKEESNKLVPNNKLDELIEQLNNPDIWTIKKNFSSVTFFFYTREQANNARKEYINHLTDEYYKLIKHYDNFNFITRDNFNVYIDSKQKFDTEYESNWFYYFKDH